MIDSTTDELHTVRDWLRWAVSRFNEAGISYGHGTENAWDEAVWLVLATLHLPQERLDFAVAKERAELRRRETLYRPVHHELDLRGRAVLLVDDGAATGSSMVAAVGALRARQPRSVRVALPVASQRALRWIERESDGCDCLATPEPFGSIANWYLDFRPLSDNDVLRTLEQARRDHSNGKRRKELR